MKSHTLNILITVRLNCLDHMEQLDDKIMSVAKAAGLLKAKFFEAGAGYDFGREERDMHFMQG